MDAFPPSPNPIFHDQNVLVVKNRVLEKKKRPTFFLSGGGGE